MFDKPIEQMDFNELRKAVQKLYDAFAIQSREYADLLQNLDTDNFSPEIKKAINSAVTGEMSESVIKQTAQMIFAAAWQTYSRTATT